MRFLIALFLFAITTSVHTQDLTLLDDEVFANRMWKEQEPYFDHLLDCTTGLSDIHSPQRCGMIAAYHLKCIVKKLYEEGDIYSHMDHCVEQTLTYIEVVKKLYWEK